MTIARRAALAALLATPALTAATRAHAQGAEIGTAARPLKMGVTAGPHAQVMERVRDIAAKDTRVIRAAKEALNLIDVQKVNSSYRMEQGFTFELNLAGVADEHRDEFVKTGQNLNKRDTRDKRSERTGENK